MTTVNKLLLEAIQLELRRVVSKVTDPAERRTALIEMKKELRVRRHVLYLSEKEVDDLFDPLINEQ